MTIFTETERIIMRYENKPRGVFSCTGYMLIQEGTSQAHCPLHHSSHQYPLEIVPKMYMFVQQTSVHQSKIPVEQK